MSYIKRTLLAVIACAITLQAQAGISEYAAQVKELVWNHKGKIAIGLVTLAVTSGLCGLLYKYVESYNPLQQLRQSIKKINKGNAQLNPAMFFNM